MPPLIYEGKIAWEISSKFRASAVRVYFRVEKRLSDKTESE
jgi:hypothetical protein